MNNILREKNVLTIPGNAFGFSGKDFIRLSYGGKKEELEKGLTEIINYFKK